MQMALILLAVFIGPSLILAEELCSSVKILDGNNCDSLRIEFDLARCGVDSQKEIRTTKCWNQKAVGQIKVNSLRHVATFIQNNGEWKLAGPLRMDKIDGRSVSNVTTHSTTLQKRSQETSQDASLKTFQKTAKKTKGVPALRPLGEL